MEQLLLGGWLSPEAWWGLQSWGQALLRCCIILGSPSLATGAHEGCCKQVASPRPCKCLRVGGEVVGTSWGCWWWKICSPPGAEPPQNTSLLLPGSPFPGSRDGEISSTGAQGQGREHQHWHCQFPKDEPYGEAHHSCTTSWAAPAPATVGNSPRQRQPPLSLASSASWGAELSPALGSWVPVSPHPAWLARDAVKSWGCPLLITHVGAEAFIVGKALLPHSGPLAAPESLVLRARLRYLLSSCEPHDLQPAYLKSNAELDGVPGLCPRESAICHYLGNWFFQGRIDPDCFRASFAAP